MLFGRQLWILVNFLPLLLSFSSVVKPCRMLSGFTGNLWFCQYHYRQRPLKIRYQELYVFETGSRRHRCLIPVAAAMISWRPVAGGMGHLDGTPGSMPARLPDGYLKDIGLDLILR